MNTHLQKFVDKSEMTLTYIALFATFSIMILTTMDAIGRYLFGSSFGWIFDISEKYLMVLTVFMAAAYGYRKGAQIRVTFVVDRLPDRWTAPINYLVLLLSIVFCLLLMVASARRAIAEIGTGAVLGTVNLPLWPGYVVVPVGLFFMVLLMVFDLPRIGRENKVLAGEDFDEHYTSEESGEKRQDKRGAE